MAIIAEEYYTLLEEIQKITPIERQIDSLAPKIEIDLNTRQIKLNDVKYIGDREDNHILSDYFAVESDHRSKILYFLVDRYYEDVDLMTCTCAIEYINADDEARLYPVTIKDGHPIGAPGKMWFAWNLSDTVTFKAGKIKFAIWFYRANQETRKLIYSLKTLPAEGTILESLTLNEAQKDEYNSYYGELDVAALTYDLIEATKIKWIDL